MTGSAAGDHPERVFDRHYPSHPFAGELRKWESCGSPERGALASNIRCDHRVTGAREKSLSRVFHNKGDLERALVLYKKDFVKARKLPEFVYRDKNEINIVKRPGKCEVRSNLNLATVLDVFGLHDVLLSARANGHRLPGITDVPSSASDYPAWLDEQFGDSLHDPESVDQLIASVLRAAAEFGKQSHNLTWATTWHFLAPIAAGPGRGWLEALGMPRRPGRWLIVLRYLASEVPTLVRPTCLDAGWDAAHFPSPPEAPLNVGGHPVQLGASADGALGHEFIHRSIAHPLRHWVDGGRLLRRVESAVKLDLVTCRPKHRSRLQAAYGTLAVESWMPRTY